MITSSSVIQTPRQMPLNGASAQVPVESPQITRHKRDTETSAEPDDDTLARDDSYMAERVANGMIARNSRPDASRQARLDIDPYSTFGQWWAQLGRAMSNPAVREWAIAQGITDPRTISISPEKGEISFQTKPDRLIKTFGPGDKEWSAVSGPILAAAKIIAAGSDSSSFHPALSPTVDNAPLSLVLRFYGVPQTLSPNEALEYARMLQRDKTFPDAPSALSEVRSEDALKQQTSLLGDHITEHEAKRTLKFVFNHMQSNQLANSLIDEHLDGQMFLVHPDSTYPKDKQNNLGQTSLKQYVEHNGWKVPTNSHELNNLAAALLNPAPTSLPNANYAGALAWPIPLDSASESHLKTILRQGKIGDIDLSPFKNVLEYLMGDMTPTYAESRNNPRQIIDKLIQSPKGQALGKAIQTLFDARSVKGSADDWLLAALSLHQDDKADTPGESPKASIAGRSFAVPDQVNRSASSFIFRLAEGEVFAGKASTLDKAWVQTHLLLSTRAPEFLVKDIPDKVAFGSHSWVSFATAVGRLEAIAPGSTATMNYADVMRHASVAPITEAERQIEYLAQQEALKDWGAANGLSYPQTAAQMNTVREAFNAQVNELKAASEALSTPMPTGKDLALKYLTTAMPDMDPALFDKKCITASPVNLDYPGPYSLLDLYLKNEYILKAPTDGTLGALSNFPAIISLTNFGEPNSSRWVSSSSDVSINEFQTKYASKQLPSLPTAFDDAFSKYITTTEKSIATQIKYLISQQPLHIQQAIENGELTILRKDKLDYTLRTVKSHDFWTPHTKERENNNLLLKIKNNGRVSIYEVDLKKGLFTDRSHLGDLQPGKYPAGQKRPDTEYVEVKPRTPSKYSSDITHEKTSPTDIPYSFKSERSSYIADAYVKNIDLPELKNQAKGMTTFDSQIVLSKKINEFMLNLIPGRSAIVNFMDGKIVEGLTDLAIDALGFVVGIGAAVKGAKAASVAASALSKVLRTTKIVGRAAIGALNPLDGAVDLFRGGAKLARHGFNKLSKGLTKVDALSLAKVPGIAEGSLKAINNVEDVKVFAKLDDATGNWHAIDPKSGKAYGGPLENFQPKVLSSDELKGNIEKLYKVIDGKSELRICYATALRSAQADKKITEKTFKTLISEVLNGGTPRYNELMNINPSTLKDTFRAADVSESGVVTFVSKGGYNEGKVTHAVYIQKASDGELYLYHSNSHTLDQHLGGLTTPPATAGEANVYKLGIEQQAGIQNFMNSAQGYSMVFTPTSSLNARVTALAK
ncbi:hypothetical protein [Pseudomonas fluorescens]|uniref:hypothetical protein n=1 Tax=Pseudomonas fluorescens TaxID=294 RepID=UPI001BEC59D6|nr:hypothetical protein [Pseudomonas fluorescens]MBT2372790.1 hypothetical protein [Pseudomonas fluorescens]